MKRSTSKSQRTSHVEKGESWQIHWTEYGKDAYLYGSEIAFHGRDNVEFYNALMPPGTVIKSWHSKTNFQRDRIEPSLPMIDGEGRYAIKADITTDEYTDNSNDKKKIQAREKHLKKSTGWLLKLVYYDRYDAEVGSQVIRDGSGTFRCPLQTFSYELQLINAGVRRLHFHSITIAEIPEKRNGE